jgi:hypothetical protein
LDKPFEWWFGIPNKNLNILVFYYRQFYSEINWNVFLILESQRSRMG